MEFEGLKKYDLLYESILNDKLICIHNRDDSLKISQNIDIHHHRHRNFNPNNFIKTINYFNSKGYFIIRMGNSSDVSINVNSDFFLDYTRNYEINNKLNDIILLSNCKFYLGSDSGISNVPRIFGKKSYLCNFAINQIHQLTFFYSSYFIPKKILNIEKNKILSLREIFESKIILINMSLLKLTN